ncbi:MAG: bifunctional folylpolyglutamate synthase/dihydrofolate synthase [Erysipelotrichales bacterium]|nr:bifunctional folylpolyglutamate synthase/dihydrofolate synthase [Erysipelotrichales bacterium]
MNCEKALDYLKGFRRNGIKPGLERVQELLKLLGNPQDSQKFIHVSGTNGKGSTCYMLSEILKRAGYKTGLFTSPPLHKINEMFHIDKNIEDYEFALVIKEISYVIEDNEYLKNNLTEFELLTVAAIYYFKQSACEFVLFETGLGGSLDATNIVSPLISVVTKISFDHMEYLGSTIQEIATAESGIIKDNKLTVLAVQNFPEIEKIIKDKAFLKNNKLYQASSEKLKNFQNCFSYKGFTEIKLALLGEHQIENALTVLETITALKDLGYKINICHIREALSKVYWPGRLEKISPNIFLDVSHNVDGVNCLVNFFKKSYPEQKITFVFGVLKDKQYRKMIELFAPIAKSIYAVKPESERALDPFWLSMVLGEYGITAKIPRNIQEALDLALSEISSNDILCIFGSFYLVGPTREILRRTLV